MYTDVIKNFTHQILTLVFFLILAISFGGIGNVIQYIRNEGLTAAPSSNNSSNNRLGESEQKSSVSINISVTENTEQFIS